MAHSVTEGRTLKDADLWDADIALPTVNGTVYSQDFDLGADGGKGENYEVVVKLPLFTTTHLPSAADSLTVSLRNGGSASPTTVIATKAIPGTAANIAAQEVRFKVPSDAARYARVGFVGAGNGNMAAINAEAGLAF